MVFQMVFQMAFQMAFQMVVHTSVRHQSRCHYLHVFNISPDAISPCGHLELTHQFQVQVTDATLSSVQQLKLLNCFDCLEECIQFLIRVILTPGNAADVLAHLR